jgi:methylmalonyl-CoA/ethylmalonyl-CoA epimerase
MAAVTFLHPGTAGNPAIELVAPLDDHAPVSGFLRRGGGLHHVCYEVDNLEVALRDCLTADVKLVRNAAPAVAFDRRPIAWIYTRYGLLVELLERPAASDKKAVQTREELP